MGDGRHISDIGDFEAGRIQCTYRRLAPGTRSLYAHLEVFHAELLHDGTDLLGRDLRCKRRALTRTPKTGTTRRRPGKRVPLAISDRDDSVVE